MSRRKNLRGSVRVKIVDTTKQKKGTTAKKDQIVTGMRLLCSFALNQKRNGWALIGREAAKVMDQITQPSTTVAYLSWNAAEIVPQD